MVRILNHNFNNNYNMNRQEVVAKVVAAIFEILEGTISEISEKDSLENDLALDSLDTVDLMMRLEQEFDIQINDEDFEADNMKVSDVVDFIMKALKDKPKC